MAATTLGMVLLIGLTYLLFLLFGVVSSPSALSVRGREELGVNIARLALTILAGAGGLVALVVSYRRQLHLELDTSGIRDQEKAYRDRYTSASQQLGSPQPAVRLAGIYAMANLADVWLDQRQQCVDVLCAYLRLPFVDQSPVDPQSTTTEIEYPDDPSGSHRRVVRVYGGFFGEREVRRTLIRIISDHVQPKAVTNWSSLNFDFRGAELRDFEISGTTFTGDFDCSGASFTGESPADLSECVFNGKVNLNRLRVDQAGADFGRSRFNSIVSMNDVTFLGPVNFTSSSFSKPSEFKNLTSRGRFLLTKAEFLEPLTLDNCALIGDVVNFRGARFAKGLTLSGTIRASDVRLDEMIFGGAKTTVTGSFQGGDFSLSDNQFGSELTEFRFLTIQPIDFYFKNNAFSHTPFIQNVDCKPHVTANYDDFLDLLKQTP